jgi:polysaccharide pyruvyl transferase WcaK-like protein
MQPTAQNVGALAAVTAPRSIIVGGNFGGKGAEAMMLTVRDAIRARFPDAACCVPVTSVANGRAYFEQGLVPVQRRERTLGMRRVDRWLTVNKVVRPAPASPIELFRSGRDIINHYRCSDAVIDIRGFLGSDEFGPGPSIGRFLSYELAKATGNRVVLMPQSWGPFRNPIVRDYVARLVRLADLVFARERESLAHLAELPGVDVSRIVLAPDIAFHFRSDPPEVGDGLLARHGLARGDRPLVGITPNMRIVERTQGQGEANAYLQSLIGLGRWFLDHTDAGLVLIPHEFTPGRANDPELCASVAAALNAPGRIMCLAEPVPAASIKSLIARLDFVIASRYHSLVAAISTRTPVAVIGWSHKYDELMERAGLADWVLDPARRPGLAAQDLIVEAWEQREAIRSALVRHVPALEADSRVALDLMLEQLVRR